MRLESKSIITEPNFMWILPKWAFTTDAALEYNIKLTLLLVH